LNFTLTCNSGRNKGARYDGTFEGSTYVGDCTPYKTGSVSSLSSGAKADMTRYIKAQIQAYETKTGWIFWTWHTEGAPGWDMQDLITNGVFPQPIAGSGC
jgi:glucan 1,3-beta-glucosidase